MQPSKQESTVAANAPLTTVKGACLLLYNARRPRALTKSIAWKLIMLAPIIGLLIPLFGCSDVAPVDEPPPLPVEVANVVEASGEKSGVYPARIAYDREVILSPRVSGVIRRMPATIGQRLKAGALVLELDSTLYQATLARAQAEARLATRNASRDASLVDVGAIAALDAQNNADQAIAARAARTSAEYDLASTRLTMPFPGVVLAKSSDVGATVLPGQAVVTVADLGSPLIARALLPLEEARAVARGTPAKISVAGRIYDGRVLRVHPAADARTGSVEVVVAITTPRGQSGPVSGAAGTVRVSTYELGGAFAGGEQLIPAEALVDAHAGRSSVYLLDQRSRTAKLTKVRLLGPGDDGWRVSGLPVGSKVITSGAGFVKDGQQVTVATR